MLNRFWTAFLVLIVVTNIGRTQSRWTAKDSTAAERKWIELRKDAAKHMGEKVRWKVCVTNILGEQVWVRFHPHQLFAKDYTTALVSSLEVEPGIKGWALVQDHFRKQGFPEIHEDDWIIVSGKFSGITDVGYVRIIVTNIENLGPDL